MTIEQFGQTIQSKYPQYQGKDAATVGQAMLAKYPQYQSQIDKPQKLSTGGAIWRGVKQAFGAEPGGYAPIPNPVDMAKQTAEPFLKGAATAVRTVQSTPQVFGAVKNAATGDTQAEQQNLQRANQTMAKPVFSQKTLEGSSNAENIGSALNAGSNLIGLKGELPGILNSQVGRSATTGFAQGATQAVGSYLQSDQPHTFAGGVKAGLGGGFTGAVTGGVAAKANPLFTSDINSPQSLTYKATHPSALVPDVLSKDVPTLRNEAMTKGLQEQNSRLKSVGNSFKENTKTITQPDGTKTTVTPADTFTKYGIKPEVTKGTIDMGDYKTGTGALGEIKTQVQNLDSAIDSQLESSGKILDLEQLKNEAIAQAKADPTLKRQGAVSSTVAKLESRFNDYQASYGDMLDIKELNEIRKVANQDYTAETHDASRVVGDVARKQVYDATPDQAVKGLLQEQGSLLSAKDYAEKLNGTKVKGGRLGNYALRTAGAIIGSTVDKMPVAGPLLGAMGGEYLARGLQASQFSSPLAEAKAAIQKIGSQPVGLSIHDVSAEAAQAGETFNRLQQQKIKLLDQGLSQNSPQVKNIVKAQQKLTPRRFGK
jgi:hypothetical protein